MGQGTNGTWRYFGQDLLRECAASYKNVPKRRHALKPARDETEFVLLPATDNIYKDDIWGENTVVHYNARTVIMKRIDIKEILEAANPWKELE